MYWLPGLCRVCSCSGCRCQSATSMTRVSPFATKPTIGMRVTWNDQLMTRRNIRPLCGSKSVEINYRVVVYLPSHLLRSVHDVCIPNCNSVTCGFKIGRKRGISWRLQVLFMFTIAQETPELHGEMSISKPSLHNVQGPKFGSTTSIDCLRCSPWLSIAAPQSTQRLSIYPKQSCFCVKNLR